MPSDKANGSGDLAVEDERHPQIQIMGVTPVTADAMKEMKRYEFAVPAQEATRQAVERTKQEYTRYAAMTVCVLAALVAVCLMPTAGGAIAAIVAVFGASAAVDKLLEKFKPKGKAPTDPEAGD